MAVAITTGYTFKTGEDVSKDILPKKLGRAFSSASIEMSAGFLLGSGAAGTSATEITLGTGLSFSGTTLNGSASSSVPTIQVFTSGSGTYTRPASARAIVVRMVGGGGGGAGGDTAINGAASGVDGGVTTFGSALLTCNGGIKGTNAPSSGAGGTATGGDFNISGGRGTGQVNNVAFMNGFPGGGSAFGGSPALGAGGGGGNGGPSLQTGGAGGAGGYLEKLIASPSMTYAYAIGAAGTGGAGGTSGGAGAAGGAGIIIVIEFY